jgi:hypothetical protein
VQIGQTFDRIGEGLFVDLGVFRLDPVTDGTVGDGGNGRKFSEQVRQLGIRERVTAPQSPSQNTYVERTIWSIRRECLNHILVMSERHLRRWRHMSIIIITAVFTKPLIWTVPSQEHRNGSAMERSSRHHRFVAYIIATNVVRFDTSAIGP